VDGFAQMFPEHKFHTKCAFPQQRHPCGGEHTERMKASIVRAS
jgi:hypothetical protein